MDVNGTRYHLIYGHQDWGACLAEPQGSQPLALRWLAGDGGTDAPAWDEARSEVVLPARIFQFIRSPGDRPVQLADRRGAAGDVFGSLYWISDDEQGIMVRSAGSGRAAPFWSSLDPVEPPPSSGFHPVTPALAQSLRLRGLAVTGEHYLVVGVLDPPGLLVFDLHGGGEPTRVTWPEPPPGVPHFAPFDMAARQDGGLWILDRALENPTAARLWSLDRRLNMIDLHPQNPPPPEPAVVFAAITPPSPLDEHSSQACPPPAEPSYDFAIVVRAGNPAVVGALVAVEALNDQSALLLDNSGEGGSPAYARLLRCGPDGMLFAQELSLRVLEDRIDESLRPDFSLLGHDFLFLPAPADPKEKDAAWGTLIVTAQEGNQSYAFLVRPSGVAAGGGLVPLALKSEPRYLPMRLFGGRGLALGSQSGQLRACYDSGLSPVNWVPLADQKRPRYAPFADLYTPLRMDSADTHLRSALDSGLPDCVWHRLMIDACLPPGASLEIWSRAANSESALALTAWQQEPTPYRRGDGSELPYLRGTPNADPASGTWELLFQNACGRFLQIQVRLLGDGRSSPSLRAMRAYYPRFSYLEQYLPAVYSQDPISASFLERYLANMEGIYTALEDRIASVQSLFDERTVPAEYLDWLASWFGMVFDAGWEENRKRLFLAHAAELFNQRGTLTGMVRMIRLATDACPGERIFRESLEPGVGQRPSPVRIVESFRTRQVPAIVFGDPSSDETPSFDLPEQDQPWKPDQHASRLHSLYQRYLEDVYATPAALAAAWESSLSSFAAVKLPALPPENAAAARDRRAFLRQALPFPYADPTAQDLPRFQDFLARRYDYISGLNAAYNLSDGFGYASFQSIGYPAELPESGAPLYDWIEFVSIVLPTRRSAHHFTVLIPTITGAQDERNSMLIERVERIVALEKPAHTTFIVKEYWAMFRVGEARLGLDTQIGTGSRLSPVVLNASYLAQGYLYFSHPWSAANRSVLGRDRLGPSKRSQV